MQKQIFDLCWTESPGWGSCLEVPISGKDRRLVVVEYTFQKLEACSSSQLIQLDFKHTSLLTLSHVICTLVDCQLIPKRRYINNRKQQYSYSTCCAWKFEGVLRSRVSREVCLWIEGPHSGRMDILHNQHAASPSAKRYVSFERHGHGHVCHALSFIAQCPVTSQLHCVETRI